MKLTTGILAITITMAAGAGLGTKATAQNTDAIDNARSVAKSLQQKQTNDTNAALDAAGVAAPSKPAPGAPAPAVKPAVIPGSTPAAAPASAAKPATAAPKPAAAAKPAAKAAPSSSQNNQLQGVKVAQGSSEVQIQIQSSAAVTPRVSKLSSPARVLVELPETAIATSQTKIPVNSAGVKGVRIGMDGKTPPTTSVVVDLEKACAYEMGSGPGGQLILTLHTDGAAQETAKSSPAPAKTATPAKTAAAKPAAAQVKTVAATPAAIPAPKAAVAKAPVAKPAAEAKSQAKAAPAAKSAAPAKAVAAAVDSGKSAEPAKPKQEEKKWAMNGKRDPFFSPVVQQASGSGCSTGKKCLEIGNINLRGVVKSDSGFIAVVTNNLNKAYFLRENDPVFNGYVVKITGDSVVFQETVQDKLGKPFTREVVKRIYTPAV